MSKIVRYLKLGSMFFYGSLAFSSENLDELLLDNYDDILKEVAISNEILNFDSTTFPFVDFSFPFDFMISSDIRGNGGDTVVCDENLRPSSKHFLYDYVESRELRGIQIKQPEVLQDSVRDYLAALLNRIAIHDPERAKLYAHAANQLLANLKFVRVPLKDIWDTGELPVRVCDTFQTAVQVETKTIHDKRFLIRQSHWDRMDNFNRAGLILHEIIYSDALMYGQKNSYFVRYFNSLIASNLFEKISTADYLRYLDEARIADGRYYGENFKYFVTTKAVPVSEAASLCNEQGADLATVNFYKSIFKKHFGKIVQGKEYWVNSYGDVGMIHFNSIMNVKVKFLEDKVLPAICSEPLN